MFASKLIGCLIYQAICTVSNGNVDCNLNKGTGITSSNQTSGDLIIPEVREYAIILIDCYLPFLT
jgi:hypothetical protein